MSSESDRTTALQGMLELAEGLQPIKDAVNGHRAWAKDSGYCEDVADRMALAMHDHLLAIVFRQATPTAAKP